MPGQKLSMSSFIPATPEQTCRCGSGQRYADCCRRRRKWHPICPNPDIDGYSLAAPQAATFDRVDGQAIRERLNADIRLHCVDEDIESSFWILWGDPAFEDEYGVLCFGDIELRQNHTLVVSAMSDVRMRVLLELLQEIAGDHLGRPRMSWDPLPAIDKPSGKRTPRTSKRKPRGKRPKR
jgi:hypothetical protein